MRKRDVEKVRVELDRLRERLDALQMMCGARGYKGDYYAGPEAASVRRASMDLTRALAELRHG